MLRAPLPTHGVVAGPIFTRPIAASSQSPSGVMPCSQIQRSACCAPQLWPAMPRQPSTGISRPFTDRRPEKRAAGAGESNFVRGSGARYIQRARQVEERLLGALERQLPGELVADPAARAVRAHAGLPHSQPIAALRWPVRAP